MQKFINAILIFISLFLTFGTNTFNNGNNQCALNSAFSHIKIADNIINNDCTILGLSQSSKKLLGYKKLILKSKQFNSYNLENKTFLKTYSTNLIIAKNYQRKFGIESFQFLSQLTQNEINTRAP